MKKIIFLALVLNLLGCGGSDPLAGYSDDVRNAKSSKPKADKPLPQDALRISADDLMTFKEGSESSFKVTGYAYENLPFHIEVENSPKNSSYDGATGIFKWTPEFGTSGDKPVLQFPLKINLIVDQAPYISISRTVSVVVQKIFPIPSILKIESAKSLCEGETSDIEVVVQDQSSSATNPPVLVFGDVRGERSAVSYLSVITSKFDGQGNWTFKVQFNGGERDLTKGQEAFHFTAKAVSPFGYSSPTAASFFEVNAASNDPILTWSEDAASAPAGKSFRFSFSAVDPDLKQTVSISIDKSTDIKTWPGKPSFVCDSSQKGMTPCTLSWDVPSSNSGETEFDLKFNVTVINPDRCSNSSKVFYRKVNIVR